MSENYEGCYFCDVTNPAAVEEHHLVPRRYNGTDLEENLVDLCGSCHNKIEELYDDGFYERLGVAVDQVKNDGIGHESGEAVDPTQSIDRKIPPESEHVRVESLTEGSEKDAKSAHTHQSKGLNPHDRPTKAADELTDMERGSNSGVFNIEFPESYRLHCGYCHTVFGQQNHSDMARHLRVRHGIENPYEVRDSTFRTRTRDEHPLEGI